MFREEVRDDYERVKFTLPKLEPGAVIEYRYDWESDNPLHIPSWDFQHAHPTLYSEYEVRIPGFLEFVTLTTGNQNYDTVEEEQTPSTFGPAIEKSWVMTTLPALREEPYMTTPDDYRSRIRLQAQAMRNPRTGVVVERFLTSWTALAKTQMEADNFGAGLGEETGGFLQGEDVVRKKVEGLTGGADSDSAKMHEVYDYVQASIEWNGTVWRSRKKDFDEILTSKTGNSAEVNLLLVSMLQLAGVEAHPVMISTRDHGKVFPLYPFLDQFNAVIAAVQLPDRDEPVLLDATGRLCPPGLLPERDLNRRGWLVKTDNPRWIEISPPSKTRRRVFVRGRLTADGSLDATVNVNEKGYPARETRRALEDGNAGAHLKDEFLDHLTSGSISDVTVTNRDTLRQPLLTDAKVTNESYARSAGDMLYVRLRVVPSVEENPFERKNRSFPVDIPHPQRTSYILKLRLPDGYEVKDVPETRRLKLPNGYGTFTRFVRVSGRQVMLRAGMELTASKIPPKAYGALRAFFTRVVSAQSEQLVLEKVPDEASGGTEPGE